MRPQACEHTHAPTHYPCLLMLFRPPVTSSVGPGKPVLPTTTEVRGFAPGLRCAVLHKHMLLACAALCFAVLSRAVLRCVLY